MGLESENTSDHERENVIGKPMGGALNMEENDAIHEKMMELEPLLEASGERNLRSIDFTHGESPCHCLVSGVVSGSRKPLPDLGCGRNSVVRTAQSSAEGDHLGGEHDAGSTMD